MLKEHSYLFLDSNGWPISLAQEEKLTVVDLIYDHTVRLSLREMEYESQPTAMMYHPSMGNAYHVKKTLAGWSHIITTSCCRLLCVCACVHVYGS